MTNPAMCEGKYPFNTYKEALSSSKRLNRNRDGAKANPYKCTNCDKFHVGNSVTHHPLVERMNRSEVRRQLRHGAGIKFSEKSSGLVKAKRLLRSDGKHRPRNTRRMP